MNKTRKVFVTGGTGYIGSRLIPVLDSQGCEVHALARVVAEPANGLRCVQVQGQPVNAAPDEIAPVDQARR